MFIVIILAIHLIFIDGFNKFWSLKLTCNKSQYSLYMNEKNLEPMNGIIIGNGRIGSFLYESNQQRDILLQRNDVFPLESFSGPVYIATRNNDLKDIIEKTPINRRNDLIFLQNGVLNEFLNPYELQDNTQGLIYFAISKKNEKPIDGITEINPNGLTAVTGKWANDFALRLRQLGLTCRVLDKTTWIVAMVRHNYYIQLFLRIH